MRANASFLTGHFGSDLGESSTEKKMLMFHKMKKWLANQGLHIE